MDTVSSHQKVIEKNGLRPPPPSSFLPGRGRGVGLRGQTCPDPGVVSGICKNMS